ncbi:Metal-dependent hydrolase, beta-lactamase superfamily II [Lentibacillus persicus]|uniref:Metal-dependent hydrolase, beta-lactamase superfamily II n=1 Tax=Lentibacillus persicus TaxID=640948 RepID=A0A1I1ZFH9_9BACI|nr:MBL fold metallo-hydrolase [Lentibacillus persicus]SFE30425.1 Metal-dependent hydrolase, beta-lactamase superfamily II [Lentibacillus persicus]
MQWQNVIWVISVIMAVAIFAPDVYHAEQASEMEVHFIDVDQGDSILIQTPSGKNILIDGGPPKAGKKVTAFLEKQDVKKLDLMIATHPDIDHIGGLLEVMKSVDVERIMDTGKIHSTRTYARYISQIMKRQIPIEIAERNDFLQVDPLLQARILNTDNSSKSNNESSIVLKLTFGKIDFLLMSDVKKKQEKELIEKHNLNSEIVKVAHHGSRTSTSLDFLKKVSPNAAILTYGKKNRFGHPVDRVMKNLQKVGTAIYPTAAFGDITVRTDGKGFVIYHEKNPLSSLKAS